MSYTVKRDGVVMHRYLGGPRRLAEVLNDDEFNAVERGDLAALREGAVLDLSARMHAGDTVQLEAVVRDGDERQVCRLCSAWTREGQQDTPRGVCAVDGETTWHLDLCKHACRTCGGGPGQLVDRPCSCKE